MIQKSIPVSRDNIINTLIALLTASGLLAGHAEAASAVAMDARGYLMTSQGQPTKEIAIYNALTSARQRYGVNVRLIAASDADGYCAIAVARNPKGGSVIAAAIGRRTQAEADSLAIGQCIKGGGVDTTIIRRWRG